MACPWHGVVGTTSTRRVRDGHPVDQETSVHSGQKGERVLVAKREPKLLRIGAAAHELGLHPITVRRWIKAGRIQVIPVGREVRIPRTEVERLVGKIDGRLLVLYGRVSGHGQKDDLEIQLKRLQAWAETERRGVETLVLSDIGSGLKASRRQLQRLLKLVCEDKVGEVAITYEDRLTRFGQEYLETLFACFGVTLTVLEPGEEKTPEQELTDDLLALIASFSGRLYGMRSHQQKELLQCAQAVLTSP
jgi:putative resolvase